MQVGFATVGGVVVAIRPVWCAGCNGASAIGASRRSVRQATNLAATVAVVHVGGRGRFATISGIAVAIGKTGAAGRSAFAAAATGGPVVVRASRATGATIGAARREIRLAAVVDVVVAIAKVGVARQRALSGIARGGIVVLAARVRATSAVRDVAIRIRFAVRIRGIAIGIGARAIGRTAGTVGLADLRARADRAASTAVILVGVQIRLAAIIWILVAIGIVVVAMVEPASAV